MRLNKRARKQLAVSQSNDLSESSLMRQASDDWKVSPVARLSVGFSCLLLAVRFRLRYIRVTAAAYSLVLDREDDEDCKHLNKRPRRPSERKLSFARGSNSTRAMYVCATCVKYLRSSGFSCRRNR